MFSAIWQRNNLHGVNIVDIPLGSRLLVPAVKEMPNHDSQSLLSIIMSAHITCHKEQTSLFTPKVN